MNKEFDRINHWVLVLGALTITLLVAYISYQDREYINLKKRLILKKFELYAVQDQLIQANRALELGEKNKKN